MALPEQLAVPYINPVNSQWDGNLTSEFSKWGYVESERAQLCDFDTFWGMGRAFHALGLDAASSWRGGSNQCLYVGHGDSLKKDANGRVIPIPKQRYNVDGQWYRSTGAYSTLGINPFAGHIFFISRKSATEAAVHHGIKNLPRLRANSDFAWGLWSRVAKASNNINAFWSIAITNLDTQRTINRALRARGINAVQEWPGTQFDVGSLEGLAILGSSNAIAAGFFLAQHKRQLGGDKMIHRITVFKATQPVTRDDFPNLILWVRDVPPGGGVDVPGSVELGSGLNDSKISMLRADFEEAIALRKSRLLGGGEERSSVVRHHVL
ncbi:hypothetical protein ACN47E_005567 [Coniothyrium glycines]